MRPLSAEEARRLLQAVRGDRLEALYVLTVHTDWGKNVTLLASMSLRGMGPCLAVEGSTTSEVFEAYLKHVLAPSLRARQVVVMDNLTAHKDERVRELIEGRGCKLLYLPPYSPDFNPIEEAFAKLKALLLGKAQARSREGLIKAMHGASSSTVATEHWTKCYDRRSSSSLLLVDIEGESSA
jgi:transposase